MNHLTASYRSARPDQREGGLSQTRVASPPSSRRRVAETAKRVLIIGVSVACGELLAKAVWFWIVLDRMP